MNFLESIIIVYLILSYVLCTIVMLGFRSSMITKRERIIIYCAVIFAPITFFVILLMIIYTIILNTIKWR